MQQKMILGPEHKTRWVTISEDEYESMKRTIEVLADKGLVKQLIRSEQDVKEGKTIPLSKLLKS